MLESINTGTSSNRIFDQIQHLKFNSNKHFSWYLSNLVLNLLLNKRTINQQQYFHTKYFIKIVFWNGIKDH